MKVVYNGNQSFDKIMQFEISNNSWMLSILSKGYIERCKSGGMMEY